MSALCNGIIGNLKPKIIPCRKCKCRRKHDIYDRYDSFLLVCRTCKHSWSPE